MKTTLLDKHQAVFGLDIGEHEAKFIQLRHSRKSYHLLGLGSVAFEDSTIIDGVIAEPEMLAQNLLEGIHHTAVGKITARSVATSVPQSHLFTRILTIPAMEPAKLLDAIHWEAQQYIPMPMDDLYTDYEIVENIKDESGAIKEHEVLLVAAPRAIVDSYMKLFELMKLSPHSLEMGLTANIRALWPTSTKAKQPTTLVMDVGSVSTDMAVVNNVIRVTTTVAIGGDQITQQLIKKLKIAPAEAEEIKIKFGIAKSDLQPKIQAALQPTLRSLLAEITKLIKYHEERTKTPDSKKVERVFLTGGASRMPGLAQFVSQATQLPVDISSPWDHYHIVPAQAVATGQAPIYTTAFGLAMREFDGE